MTSKSTKSASNSKPKLTRRRSSLLKNGLYEFETATQDDLPWLWAAYRKGALAVLGEAFASGLTQDQFRANVEFYIHTQGLVPIAFYTGEDRKMVGIGLFWLRGRCWQTENLIWFPWATPKNILASYVNFVNVMRNAEADSGKYFILEFAQEKDQKFFDTVCLYGVMRRAGTMYEFYKGGRACVYESRSA